ncbi:MAG: C25 family cysteine peptidase, partial [Chitinophagales bacterium]
INFAVDNWSINPEYLFLVGKGIGYRTTLTPSTFRANLIPTFGHQPSDIILTARTFNDYRPQVAVGRLSANTPEDVANYFHKIQQYEDIAACSIEERTWRKNALFQTVGDDEDEYSITKSYLEKYQPILESSHFGGNVLDLQAGKNYDPLFATTPFIERGIGLLHFFGHSTGQIWKSDVLKNVNAYEQSAPRFPFIFSSSSFTGNIFKSTNSDPSMSENWVRTKNKGAIGYLGTVSFHWIKGEDVFYTELYNQMSQTNYNQPIGKILKETIESVYMTDENAPLYNELRATVEQHAYEGDPALVIGGSFEHPEYVVNQGYEYTFVDVEDAYTAKTEIRNDVTLLDATTGEELPSVDGTYDFTGIEEVALKVRVTNLGKAVEGDIELSVVKISDNGLETIVTSQMLTAPAYEMTYELNVPIEAVNALEEYEWSVRVSSPLEEDCADNNDVSVSVSQGSVSIKDVWQGGKIQLYPNPVSDQLQIISPDNEPLQLQIYNLQGAMIQMQTLPNGSQTLNLSEYPNGIYWVRLTGEKG